MPALSFNLFFVSDLLLFSNVQVFEILNSLQNNHGKNVDRHVQKHTLLIGDTMAVETYVGGSIGTQSSQI